MYSDFKQDLADSLIEVLEPIQDQYNEIIQDKEYLANILERGAQNAFYIARKTLSKVYRKVGFVKK